MKKVLYMLGMMLLAGCASVPPGVDEFDFRLREAQLNVEQFRAVLPGLALPAEDEAAVDAAVVRVHALLTDALEAYRAAPDAARVWSVVETGLALLADEVADMPPGTRRTNIQRALALARVPGAYARVRGALADEYGAR